MKRHRTVAAPSRRQLDGACIANHEHACKHLLVRRRAAAPIDGLLSAVKTQLLAAARVYLHTYWPRE